jgi:DNA-binding response OmpR family regulator
MRKLLLVDDDPLFRKLLLDDLIRAPFIIEEASFLNAAKEFLKTTTFDLILLDICLPDGNGLDWACELNRNPGNPPIIFLTTSNEISTVHKGFEAGCEDYIRKPFDNQELIMRIRRALKDFKDISNQNRYIGNYVFNPISHQLSYGDSCRVLGRLQAAVLDELSIRPGTVVSKEELLTRYWNEVTYFTSRNLDSIIVKLRALFKEDPNVHFLALKREGYRLAVYDDTKEQPDFRYI